MPAINVARTDTFEQQRVKINQVSTQIFDVTAGGSDLATGNLKIGDGTKSSPSLAFDNDQTLGIYRPNNSVIGFVASNKKLMNVSKEAFISFRDFTLQKDIVGQIVIDNPGTNYDPGSYQNIPLNGGTGENFTADITVTAHLGTILEEGNGYTTGQYNQITPIGGSGTGAVVGFDIEDIAGDITAAGSGYNPVTYNNVPVVSQSGTGSNATANVTVQGSVLIGGSITSAGSGYDQDQYTGINVFNVPLDTKVVTVVSNPGTPPPDDVYVIDGVTQQTLTFIRGNTYRFDVSDSSNLGHPLTFQQTDGSILDPSLYVVQVSEVGGSSGAFIDFIISPAAPVGNIKYNCVAHDGMGAQISIINGTLGNHGFGAQADVDVDVSGNVTSFTLTQNGSNFTQGNTVTLSPNDIGASGSGFVYTLGAFTYNGVVSDIQFQTQGSGYETGDVLTVASADLGNVGGSGFEFTITNNPSSITNFQWTNKGTGYLVGETINLPQTVTGITGTLNGEVSNISTTLSTISVNITVADSSGIAAGMSVFADPTSTGEIDPSTTVASVPNSTTVVLSDLPTTAGAAVLSFRDSDPFGNVVVSSVTGLIDGMAVTVTSGTGTLPVATTISSIDASTLTLSLSEESTFPGDVVLSFTPPFGDPAVDWEYRVDTLGAIEQAIINNAGNGYEVLDTLTVQNTELVQPISIAVTNDSYQKVTFANPISAGTIVVSDKVSDTNDGINFYDVVDVKIAGGNIVYMLVAGVSLQVGGSITKEGSATQYALDTVDLSYRYALDGDVVPSITLYVGNIYRFDLTDNSNTSHNFALSKFPDGKYSPSKVENIAGTTVQGSDVVTLTSTTGILAGMEVLLTSGQGLPVNNLLVVEVIDGTQIRVSSIATTSNSIVVNVQGAEYTTSVERGSDYLDILIRPDTPNLYYYCDVVASNHENEGGFDGEEIVLTIDVNNPKTFGSGAVFNVGSIVSSNAFFADIESGKLTVVDFESPSAEIVDITATDIATSEIVCSSKITTPVIDNGINQISITSGSLEISGDVSFASNVNINAATGNIVSSGNIKTTSFLNVNDQLRIQNNVISTTASAADIELTPFSGRVAKINGSSAIIIPSGNTTERPAALAQNGAIRFNTTTGQYEGYNGATTSWASLGGVRDLDGNTYIKAEESVGSNDNNLWFINDNTVSFKFNKNRLSFESAKKVNSANTSAPAFTDYASNTAASVGQYLKYKNNLYEVTSAGVTGTGGNEPTHTTGIQPNGTAQLEWWGLAVGKLILEDIEQLDIGPTSTLPVSINSDLRLENNIISTDISDLTLRPNTGKKIVCDGTTTLALPSGPDTGRGVPIQGSVRFSTTTSQFEGYDGANWGSLGGVKDVDQNTYIIPETAPGQNENILYFYNDGNNSLQLTTTALDFYSVDTIRSMTSNEFEITANLMTFDNAATTLDNTLADKTFLYSSKQYFDIGLSAGVRIDPIFRLDNTGDVYFNTGFGTGNYNGVKVFDNEFKEFELLQTRIRTDKFTLTKGTIDTNNTVIYNVTVEEGAKTTICAHNTNTNEKEFIEFGIVDDGSDVIHSEYGNISTGNDLILPTFELTPANEVRVSIELASTIATSNVINVTIVSHVTKK